MSQRQCSSWKLHFLQNYSITKKEDNYFWCKFGLSGDVTPKYISGYVIFDNFFFFFTNKRIKYKKNILIAICFIYWDVLCILLTRWWYCLFHFHDWGRGLSWLGEGGENSWGPGKLWNDFMVCVGIQSTPVKIIPFFNIFLIRHFFLYFFFFHFVQFLWEHFHLLTGNTNPSKKY